jgi:hypothetical protein
MLVAAFEVIEGKWLGPTGLHLFAGPASTPSSVGPGAGAGGEDQPLGLPGRSGGSAGEAVVEGGAAKVAGGSGGECGSEGTAPQGQSRPSDGESEGVEEATDDERRALVEPAGGGATEANPAYTPTAAAAGASTTEGGGGGCGYGRAEVQAAREEVSAWRARALAGEGRLASAAAVGRLRREGWLRRGVRLVVVVATGVAGVAIPNFGLFLSLVGGLVCTAVAFVIPPAIHLGIHAAEAGRWACLRRGVDVAVIALGIFASVACTITTLQDMSKHAAEAAG